MYASDERFRFGLSFITIDCREQAKNLFYNCAYAIFRIRSSYVSDTRRVLASNIAHELVELRMFNVCMYKYTGHCVCTCILSSPHLLVCLVDRRDCIDVILFCPGNTIDHSPRGADGHHINRHFPGILKMTTVSVVVSLVLTKNKG